MLLTPLVPLGVWSTHSGNGIVVINRNGKIRTQEGRQSSFIHSQVSIVIYCMFSFAEAHWKLPDSLSSRRITRPSGITVTSFLSELHQSLWASSNKGISFCNKRDLSSVSMSFVEMFFIIIMKGLNHQHFLLKNCT